MPLYIFTGSTVHGVVKAANLRQALSSVRTLFGMLAGPYEVHGSTQTELRRLIVDSGAVLIDRDGSRLAKREVMQHAGLDPLPSLPGSGVAYHHGARPNPPGRAGLLPGTGAFQEKRS